MTTTHVVDPPQLYDRTPIVVSENDCELPKRGCPGRTYTLQGGCPKANEAFLPSAMRGNHHHPSAMGASATPRASMFNDRPNQSFCPMSLPTYPIPGLVSDESSSEESDGLVSPPPEWAVSSYPTPLYCHPTCKPHYHSPLCPIFADKSTTGAGFRDPNPMAFLPHPPAPRPKLQSSHTAYTHQSHRDSPPKRTRTRPPPTSSGWDNSSCLGGF